MTIPPLYAAIAAGDYLRMEQAMTDASWSCPITQAIPGTTRQRHLDPLRYALTDAPAADRIGIAMRLIDHGAAIDGVGNPPALHVATDGAIIRRILITSVAPDARDSHGHGLLHRLPVMAPPDVPSDQREAWRLDTMALALVVGCDPNLPDREGAGPLCYARTREQVQLLLDGGADPNRQDKMRRTPLFRLGGYPERVADLLAAGARPEMRDFQGRTALDVVDVSLPHAQAYVRDLVPAIRPTRNMLSSLMARIIAARSDAAHRAVLRVLGDDQDMARCRRETGDALTAAGLQFSVTEGAIVIGDDVWARIEGQMRDGRDVDALAAVAVRAVLSQTIAPTDRARFQTLLARYGKKVNTTGG